MKPTCKQLLALALILAVAAAPLGAETINSPDTATNPTTLAAPIAPPDAPAPPAPPAVQDGTVTNKPAAKTRKSDHTPVQIGANGIHIGGPDPVDIEMPSFAGMNFAHAKPDPFTMVTIITVVSVVTPFLFFLLIGALFFYFRFRRQRILHETLRAMIDKGVPIPPELLTPQDSGVRRRTRSDLRIGLVMLAIGVGLFAVIPGGAAGRVAAIPLLIGVAFLITWFIEKKDNNNKNGTTNK